MIDIFNDPVWEIMDAFSCHPFRERKIENSGLKNIGRPHNLIDVKDDNGNIVAQRLEVVSTPFAKDDVKVSIVDNVLSVNCGSENIKTEENEDIVYHGISSQSYKFALKLAPSVDVHKITAVNKDGILKVTLPRKIEEEKKPEEITVEIQ